MLGKGYIDAEKLIPAATFQRTHLRVRPASVVFLAAAGRPACRRLDSRAGTLRRIWAWLYRPTSVSLIASLRVLSYSNELIFVSRLFWNLGLNNNFH